MAKDRRKYSKPSHQSPEARVQQEILSLADRLGIGDDYRKIPDSAKRRMYANPALPPIVTVDRTAGSDPEVRDAAEGIRQGVRDAQLILGWLNDAKLPLHSFYSALVHLDHFLRGFSNQNPTHEAAARCHRVVADVAQKSLRTASSALENIVISNLLPLQRFDQKLYGVRFGRIPKGAKVRLDIQIFREQPRRASIEFEGIARPAFQCGGFMRPGMMEWVEWRPQDVGLEGTDKPCQVFVQSHALKNLQDRLGIPLPMGGGTVMMFHSLLKPNVVQPPESGGNSTGTLLVECRGEVGRVGYFVVNFLGDKFLVNTFLFLTMKGTPEAEKLYQRLHISRHTVELMNLDNLPTFLMSDLCQDKKLATVLSECGCGHLLTLTDRMPFKVTALFRQARRLRRILGWAADDSLPEELSPEQMESAVNQMKEFIVKAEQTPGLLGRILRKSKEMVDL